MKKSFLNRLCVALATLLITLVLCACNDSDRGKVVFTTALAKDELFRIDEVSCTLTEYNLYLTNMQNKYENVFGEEIWQVTFEGITFEDNMKDIVLAKIAQMKSIYLLAQEKGVTLSEAEERLIKEAASYYYNSLSPIEVEALGVTEEIVLQLYRENALADKVYKQIVSQVNPEISDDEARAVTVEQIFIRTYATSSNGDVINYTTGMKADVLENMENMRQQVISGEADFTDLAGRYNEEDNIRISFKKGEVDANIEAVAFDLQTDEVSEVIETPQGYCLLKCISTFDKEETDANKLLLIEERRNEAFGKEYDYFVKGLAKKLNDKLWQDVELIHVQEVNTNSFFEVYEDCLQKF